MIDFTLEIRVLYIPAWRLDLINQKTNGSFLVKRTNYQFNENNITDIHEVEQRLNIQVAASFPSLYFYSWSS